MRIGIVTFQETNNYGAILQNYALQKALIKLGHSPETIDYRSEYIAKPYRLRHLRDKGLRKWLLGIIGYLVYLPRTRKNKLFRQLIKYSPIVDINNIDSLNDIYDIFIAGSDQVWNCGLTGGDPVYMLGFVDDRDKCFAYAASIGAEHILRDWIELYKSYISSFNRISVREGCVIREMENLLSRADICRMPDPLVLLSRDEWDEVAVTPSLNEPYIYVYQLGVSSLLVEMADNLAREHNCKLVFSPFPVGRLSRGYYDISAGCGEVVGYIRNAEYVLTDSFHGTLMSIIYGKKFYTYSGGTHSAVGSRINDMLKQYGLETRLIEKTKSDDVIDYSYTDSILVSERKMAYEYLNSIIRTEG